MKKVALAGMTIRELQEQLSQQLRATLAESLAKAGYSTAGEPRVTLQDSTGRKKRGTAAANNWSPDAGKIQIAFEPAAPSNQLERPVHTHTDEQRIPAPPAPTSEIVPPAYATVSEGETTEAERELLRALDRAEATPGWNFVPLRKFKNEIVPEECQSLRSEIDRRAVLQSAIEKRLVLLGKVANPKAPQYPVTTIRLNRLTPEVQHLLGHGELSASKFHPVEIHGEPLSATILRERR